MPGAGFMNFTNASLYALSDLVSCCPFKLYEAPFLFDLFILQNLEFLGGRDFFVAIEGPGCFRNVGTCWYARTAVL